MKIIVQGMAVEYRDEGEGKTLLLLHGWQDDLRTFDPMVPFLPSCRIVRVDLPGFGGSEAPKTAWGVGDYARFVKDLIDKLGIEVDVAVGHSFGGRVIIKGIGARKIVLIGSAGVAKGRTLRNRVIKALAKVGGILSYLPPFVFFRERMRKRLYSSIGSDYLDAGGLKETFVKTVSEDLVGSAGSISVPTLLIWGADDRETPLVDGRTLNDAIAGSRLEVIDGAGHFVHRDDPEKVAKLIGEFI